MLNYGKLIIHAKYILWRIIQLLGLFEIDHYLAVQAIYGLFRMFKAIHSPFRHVASMSPK